MHVNFDIGVFSFSGLPTTELDVLAQLEEPRHPQINIGRDFQADLPELCNDRIDLHRVPEQLLWDPGINDALDDNEGIQIFYWKLYTRLTD